MRCLRNQSRFKMPKGEEGGGMAAATATASGSFFLWKRWILERSGRARVLMGGCCERRKVEMRGWRSGQPTMDTSVTGGVCNSSGYSSIVFSFRSDPTQ